MALGSAGYLCLSHTCPVHRAARSQPPTLPSMATQALCCSPTQAGTLILPFALFKA